MKIQIEGADLRSVLNALEELNSEKSYWWQEVERDTVKALENAESICKQALAYHTEQHLEMVEKRAYSWKYDAYFYPDKNEWEEPRCCDVSCEYCKDRPARPLDDEAAHWDMLYETEEATHD